MGNFIVAAGHTASGNIGCGVINRLDESDECYYFDDKCIMVRSKTIGQSYIKIIGNKEYSFNEKGKLV